MSKNFGIFQIQMGFINTPKIFGKVVDFQLESLIDFKMGFSLCETVKILFDFSRT